MAARSGRKARIKYTGAFTESTDQAATLAGDSLSVQIDSTGRRHWDRNSTAFPKVWRITAGSTVQISTGITTNYVQGKVTFDATQNSSATWQIDARWAANSYLPDSVGWSLDAAVEHLDVTTLSTSTADARWRSIIAGPQEATVTIDKLFGASTAPVFYDVINTTGGVLVELWVDSSGELRYEAWAEVDSDSVGVDFADPVTENVALAIDGELYYSTG